MLRCAALHCYCVGTLTLPLTIPGCQGWLAGWAVMAWLWNVGGGGTKFIYRRLGHTSSSLRSKRYIGISGLGWGRGGAWRGFPISIDLLCYLI